MKELWLTRRNDPYMRYKLNAFDCLKLYNGGWTRVFGLHKYWGEGDTWKPWGGDGEGNAFYVDIETLLSEFTLLDSPNDKYIKGLEELRDNNFKKQTEAKIDVLTDAFASISSTDEGDKEDIHTLHSGELETDETTAPK